MKQMSQRQLKRRPLFTARQRLQLALDLYQYGYYEDADVAMKTLMKQVVKD